MTVEPWQAPVILLALLAIVVALIGLVLVGAWLLGIDDDD